MNPRTPILALLTIGLLAVTAMAMPAMAKPSEHEDARDHREERRQAALDKAEHRGNVTRDRCLAAHANATQNQSHEHACMKVGEFAEKAFKARRAAHAMLGAINATERQWARLNATEDRLEARLASGNLSANETERIEHRLEKIDDKQERLADRLEALRERLANLHEKWQAVREHVDERRRMHRDADRDGDDDEDDSSESSSESVSSSSSPA